MTLLEKRDIIKRNKDPSIAALNSVLDTYYNYLSPITDEENKLINGLLKTEKAISFAEDMVKDTNEYESVLAKLKRDEDLTEKDIAYIGIAFHFCEIRMTSQIESLIKAKEQINLIRSQLQSKINY